jgi:molecular chaperone GrpE (heat shock protein)
VVTGEGVSFDALHQRMEEDERDAMGQALKKLIANLIDILAMLTGDVLVRQLLQTVERRS